jgi:hypothetical protein
MKRTIAGRRLASLIVVCVALSAITASADPRPAPTMLQRAEIEKAVRAPDIQRAQQQIMVALDEQQGKQRGDWAAVDGVLASPGLGDVEREFLLYGTLMRARNVEPDDAGVAFVSRLQSYESKTFVRHEEGPLPVAVYPIASLASGTLRFWNRRQVTRDASLALAAGDMSRLQSLRQPGSDEYAGTLAALRAADATALSLARDWLASNTTDNNAAGKEFYAARAVVAVGTGDRLLAAELLQTGEGVAAMQLLRATRQHFDATTALDLLQHATTNPSVASAALFELDALRQAGLGERIDGYLLDALADPALGATAAAIIARRQDPALLARVAGVLSSPAASHNQQARAALALTLADNQYARSALSDAVTSDRITDSDLRKELVEWLQN